MDALKQVAEKGLKSVTSENTAKFLIAVSQGKDSAFLADLWNYLSYEKAPHSYTGKCGKELCKEAYIRQMEYHVFKTRIPSRYRDRDYGALIKDSLENIADEINKDLTMGEKGNNYIRDENGNKLENTVEDIERCGVKCYSFSKKIDDLMWFVGGDAKKILALQQNLNKLGIKGDNGKLEEDGVYGKNTASAWFNFIQSLTTGSIPILNWINPLENNYLMLDLCATEKRKI